MEEHDRERIAALMSEHISEETYLRWREEASREVSDPWEVRRIVKKRTLLVLAQKTSGQMSIAMRNVARRL